MKIRTLALAALTLCATFGIAKADDVYLHFTDGGAVSSIAGSALNIQNLRVFRLTNSVLDNTLPEYREVVFDSQAPALLSLTTGALSNVDFGLGSVSLRYAMLGSVANLLGIAQYPAGGQINPLNTTIFDMTLRDQALLTIVPGVGQTCGVNLSCNGTFYLTAPLTSTGPFNPEIAAYLGFGGKSGYTGTLSANFLGTLDMTNGPGPVISDVGPADVTNSGSPFGDLAITPITTPEPGSIGMVTMALSGAALWLRRRNRAAKGCTNHGS